MRFVTKLAPALILLFFSACKKDKKIEPVTQPAVQQASAAFDFTAMTNGRVMFPDTAWYTNHTAGDRFTVSKFDYYVTNIKFIRNDGYVYAEPESYRIVRHVEKQTSFVVNGLPEGTYTGIEFLIGVDSLRNSAGAQTGALDVSQGMYWDWQTGYIFFKLEGYFTSRTFTVSNEYAMHIGTTPNAKKCSFNLTSTPIVAQKGHQSKIHYQVTIDEIFENPTNLDLNTYHAVTGGNLATNIANNYKNMFSVSGVDNQ